MKGNSDENTVRKKTNLHFVYVSKVKGLFRKGLFTHKKNPMRSHVLTKQNIVLIQKEIAINQVWKGRF